MFLHPQNYELHLLTQFAPNDCRISDLITRRNLVVTKERCIFAPAYRIVRQPNCLNTKSMENLTIQNSENLLAAKASTQPLNDFPVDQLPLGLRDSLSGVAPEARVPALFSALPIAAAYADGVKAKYCDGSETPMALMSIIIGEELGSMKSVWKTFGDYFRKAFDQSEVGQDYITATSGVTHAQLNFTGCCTQNIFQKFFTEDNIEDGSSSRMMLAKMPDTSFAPLSQHHGYTEEEQDNILKAVNLLERSHGVMELPRMCEEFCQWLEAKRLLALANADRVMDVYRRRSAVIGFRCGVIFHILEQTEEETDACIRFAKAVADYVLAMQMEMFGLRLDKQQQDNEAIPVYKSRNTLLFAQLPEQFTLFDASHERGDGASRETIRKMISRWTKRGLCKKLKSGDTEIWQKLTLSA